MDMPIDPSVNSIAPLETQQIANDAQSNPMEDAENSPNIEEVERSPNKRGLTSAAWTHFKRKKIEGKWKVICKYCEKKLGGDTRSDVARMELTKMIALHEYPLAMINHIGFRRFIYVPAPHTVEVLAEIIIEHFFEWNLDRKDGMSIIHDSIEKIRDSVSFWVGKPKREEKFIEACEQLEIPYSKKLRMDCRTR
ncbi:hypothetical protein GmHk_15G043405 [Glycine max]|nr:hypothetical protein GmHk_15G043405 [Glycine max]